MRAFVEGMFFDESSVPWDLKTYWLGMIAQQDFNIRRLVQEREQEHARLHELGRKGMPLLIVAGKDDKQVISSRIASELEPYFVDMKVAWIEKRGSHTVFYDNMEETMERITEFVNRVVGC
jgi:pimeloyl-ACP methyl ester carboxylesterase